jgi:lactate dehydrogenase-like 2-hydroxyacid dehydrogenase
MGGHDDVLQIVEGLREGAIAGAALDVFEFEPAVTAELLEAEPRARQHVARPPVVHERALAARRGPESSINGSIPYARWSLCK